MGPQRKHTYGLETMVFWHLMFRRVTGQGTFILNPVTCCLGVFQSCQCQDPLFPVWSLPGIQSCNSRHGYPTSILFFSLLIVKEMWLLGVGEGQVAARSDQKTKAEDFKEQGVCVLCAHITASAKVWKSGICSSKGGEPSLLQRGEATPRGALWRQSWGRATRIFSGEEVGHEQGMITAAKWKDQEHSHSLLGDSQSRRG